MTPKQYAHSLGLATLGKGRMSAKAHEAIAKAIAGGMVFDDPKPPVKTVKPAKVVTAPVAKPAEVTEPKIAKDEAEGTNVYADGFLRYPLDQKFVYHHDGKRVVVSGRSACMPCGYSLVSHGCNAPVVITHHGPQSVTPLGE